jgi:hypothetical protein
MQVELANGAPTGSLVTHNESGWMDKETFPMWLKHFSSAVRPSQANKAQKTKQRRTMIPSQINNIKKRKERKLKREQLHGHQTQRTLLGIVLCVASAALRT